MQLVCPAIDWTFFVKVSTTNRGDDDGKRQPLAEQGKEEAQEGGRSEGNTGEGHPSTQETLMAGRDCHTKSARGWSGRQIVELIHGPAGAKSATRATHPPSLPGIPQDRARAAFGRRLPYGDRLSDLPLCRLDLLRHG
jgi:hypothetical protein